jgi:squalene synthase HpnC
MPEARLSVKHAYRSCEQLAAAHYENFPVASWLLPRRIRKPVAAIYVFARRADDFADEGTDTADVRLAQLDAMGAALDHVVAGGESDDPLFIALGDAIARHHLPPQLFHDLLAAFRQDVDKRHYADFGEVMQYCRLSANPVGRLLLHLTGEASERNLAYSDAICSALQLINFYQDLYSDYAERGRIYISQDEMDRFGVDDSYFAGRVTDVRMRRLMEHQFQRADQLLRSGAPLGRALRGRFGMEIRAIITGGARVLHKLKQQSDLFSRPRLESGDAWHIIKAALFGR